jgi:putative ABC transport system permease protein
LASLDIYGVTARDPWVLAGAALLLGLVGLCACWVPTRRAMRVNPLNAIRFELQP